jgi:hypothetical protein
MAVMLLTMARVLAFALAIVPAAWGATGPTVVVASGIGCPPREEIEAVLEARLSSADRARMSGWTATVETGLGNTVRVELKSSDGQLQLERMLPVEPSRCAGAGDAVAIIIERRIRELGWSGSMELPEQVPPQRLVRGPTVALVVGPAFWARDGLHPAAALGVRWRPLGGHLALHAGSLLPGARRSTTLTDPAAPASATLSVSETAWPALLGVAWYVDGARLSAAAGPVLVVTIDAGQGEGLGTGQSDTRVTWSAGVGVSAAVKLGHGFETLFSVAGFTDVTHGRFLVESDAGAIEVLSPPRWQWLATIGVGWLP